jgi:hypothetical protein
MLLRTLQFRQLWQIHISVQYYGCRRLALDFGKILSTNLTAHCRVEPLFGARSRTAALEVM